MATSIRHSVRFERAAGKRALPRRRKFGSRSKRHKPRWPGVLGWSFGVVVGAGFLVAVAHVHGEPHGPEAALPDSALKTLAEPAVAAAAAFGALALIAWCVSQLRFEFLAWWPGRIVVRNFVANGAVAEPDVERLTASFRSRLGMSHLQSPAPVPAAAEQGDFLDVLARGGIEAGNVIGGLLTLLRAAVPTHAYEVEGALVKGDAPRCCGVTVHVVRLPGKGAGGHTVWDTSWEGAVRQAADHATASILPRTRVCRAPWSAWRRYYMPPELLRAYEEAAECEQDRRYDDALALYYRALREDPMNHGLRLQIGFLQEKLGLYLDALDTYGSILEVAETETPRAAHGPAARRDEVGKAYRKRARRDRARNLLVARYRRAVLLGGPGLPHQWRKWEDEKQRTKRDEERDRLRERLGSTLEELFEAAYGSSNVAATAGPVYEEADRELPRVEECGAALEKTESDTPDTKLEQALLLASLDQLADLHRRLPLRRRTTLSRAAVRVSSLVVRERLRLVLDEARCDSERNWDPYIERIDKDLAAIERSSPFQGWQEQYNAACVYAFPLLTTCNAQDRDDVKQLTQLAVQCLKRATETADSAFVASRRDWLVSEDPDLQGLRIQPKFKSFEAAYFPSASRTPQRPRDIHKWEISRYTLDLLRESAARWEETWEKRAEELDPVVDTRVLLHWCQDELSARELIREVAIHHRDWRTRFKLLRQMRSWGVEYGFKPVEVSFPDFPAEDELAADETDVDEATARAIEDKDVRLGEMVKQLELTDDPHERAASRRTPDPGGVQQAHVAQVCCRHANLWGRLRELVSPDEERGEAAAELARALADAAGACRNLQDGRVNGSVPASVARAAA